MISIEHKKEAIQYIKDNPEFLNNTIVACTKLLENYKNKNSLDHCPLCVLISCSILENECKKCVWMAMTGDECPNNAAKVRLNPNNYPDEVSTRIIELEDWLIILKEWEKLNN